MLRELELKDASYMLEWMHDSSVVEFMQADFANKTLTDCETFIRHSQSNRNDIHLAIVNESDEYMGTVSLKHMNPDRQVAEFAITIRKCAMGTGVASTAMKDIISLGKDKYHLKHIYWCVSKENARAIRFYRKNGYQEIDIQKYQDIIREQYTQEQINQMIWFEI